METPCTICMEAALIPVECQCFPCFVRDGVHCHTFTRLCLRCAFFFFQLHKNPGARDLEKKCLFCPVQINLSRLTLTLAVRPDFFLMGRDAVRHPCPFCGEHEDTQIRLYAHLLRDCPSFSVECACRLVMKREDMIYHYFLCSRHAYCGSCGSYVLRDDLDHHHRTRHGTTRCGGCDARIRVDQETEHAERWCPERLIPCAVCLCLLRSREYEGHLLEHRAHVHRSLTEQKNVLDALVEQHRLIENSLRQLQRPLPEN
ncbi:hypothetical protein EBZ80_01215 [bacterium]|nr:hypothetical protein [bacterium]